MTKGLASQILLSKQSIGSPTAQHVQYTGTC